MKKALKIFLWTLVALVLVGTFVYLFMNSRPKEEKFDTVMPTVGDIEKVTVLTGTIEPRDEINVKPQVSGIISEINVEAGQTVQAGDIIAKIKVVPDEAQLSSAQARIDAARIALADARTRHQRNSTLFARKVISREEFETTAVEVEKAQSELSAANDAYAVVKDGVSLSNKSGSNTLVRATVSGLVLDVPVKVGTSVIQANTFNDGTTVATIADMSNLIFKGSVDEIDVAGLKLGQTMKVTVGAIPDKELTAVIDYISPKSTSNSGANSFEIKAALDAPAGLNLRAGYSANASVVLDGVHGVMIVPERVVEFQGDSTFVYVMTDSANHSFSRRPIVTGLSDGINIEVRSGLNRKMHLRDKKIEDANAQNID